MNAPVRKVHCVLSARSLPYAKHAFASLLARSLETIALTLITDGPEDKAALQAVMAALPAGPHTWSVHDKAEADERAAEVFAAFPRVAAFRNGHPCWRKITDPPLFARPGEEMIVIDPDLYFPNHFDFGPTPDGQAIALMHQPPSCLLPDVTVRAAIAAGIPLAHHVDIGVAQWRHQADWAWIDHLIGVLGGSQMPRMMHIEAIVWAALALRVGGHYLDPAHWHCWRNAQWKRVALKLGVPGPTLLAAEPFGRIKCFHGGGSAKWWVPPRLAADGFAPPVEVRGPGRQLPFEELTPAAYEADQRLKALVRKLGYYRLFGGAAH